MNPKEMQEIAAKFDAQQAGSVPTSLKSDDISFDSDSADTEDLQWKAQEKQYKIREQEEKKKKMKFK